MRRFLLLFGCAFALGSLSACGNTSTSSTTGKTDIVSFQTNDLKVAYVGEPYSVSLGVTGGVGPYTYRIANGKLPDGLRFSNGTISGTPSTEGAFTFTIETADANLSSRARQYTLNVNKLPDLALAPKLPSGELRGESRIPVVITGPRNVRAVRFIWRLSGDVKVKGVRLVDAENVLLWKVLSVPPLPSGNASNTASSDAAQAANSQAASNQAPSMDTLLIADIGLRNIPRADDQLIHITLLPLKPVNLANQVVAYEARDGTGKLLSEKKLPTPPAPPAPSTPPASPAAPASAPSGQQSDSKKEDAKPATPETKPAEPKPEESKPAETKPVEQKPDATPSTPAAPTPATPAPNPSTDPNKPAEPTPPNQGTP